MTSRKRPASRSRITHCVIPGEDLDLPSARTLLAGTAARSGLELTDEQTLQLLRYARLLQEWNARVNLTAARSVHEILERHIADSLAIVPFVPADARVLDVGAGAGFPGAVLAALRADVRVLAIDSVHKKVAFLRALARDLKLSLRAEAVRLEALTGGPFDVAVSRAAFQPEEWLRRGPAQVRLGGLLLCMFAADASAVTPPGLQLRERRTYEVAGTTHAVLVFERT